MARKATVKKKDKNAFKKQHEHQWRLGFDLKGGTYFWCRTCPEKVYEKKAPKRFVLIDKAWKAEQKRNVI